MLHAVGKKFTTFTKGAVWDKNELFRFRVWGNNEAKYGQNYTCAKIDFSDKALFWSTLCRWKTSTNVVYHLNPTKWTLSFFPGLSWWIGIMQFISDNSLYGWINDGFDSVQGKKWTLRPNLASILVASVRANWIFTALHGMQSRYSDGNSVCPSVRLSVRLSVRPSNACIVTKRKKAMFRFLYHMKEHLS